MRRKQSSFNTQNIPIWGAGADGAAGAVFRDTAGPTNQTEDKQWLVDRRSGVKCRDGDL